MIGPVAETEGTQSTGIAITANDLATRLLKEVRRACKYAIEATPWFRRSQMEIDEIVNMVVLDFAEAGVRRFNNFEHLVVELRRVAKLKVSQEINGRIVNGQHVVPIEFTRDDGSKRENSLIYLVAKRASSSSIETHVYARQVWEVIQKMPAELRKTAELIVDGADLIEFAKERRLSLGEAMRAQKALREIAQRLLEDDRQERVETVS